MDIINKIFQNKDNEKVLVLLQLEEVYIRSLKIQYRMGKDAGSCFDQGSVIFFTDYAKDLPENTKYSISISNLLINSDNGQIFAFQWGRFTFVYRCDFSKEEDLKGDDENRLINTWGLDGDLDFTALGDNWAFLSDDENARLDYAYELSKKPYHN